jgi:hypothetical protein
VESAENSRAPDTADRAYAAAGDAEVGVPPTIVSGRRWEQ